MYTKKINWPEKVFKKMFFSIQITICTQTNNLKKVASKFFFVYIT